MDTNKIIYQKKFEDNLKDAVSYSEDMIKIGNLEISFKHDQDCCENVYADTESMKWYIDRINNNNILYRIEIKSVEGDGIIIFFYHLYDKRIGVFIPCYNIQNGYYSDDLTLIIKDGDKTTKIELQEAKCVFNDVE